MKVAYKNSLTHKVEQHIDSSMQQVFVRKDFESLGGYRQISRALNKLTEKNRLIKLGTGIYAKAQESKYLDEPLLEGGFDIVAREALDRIGVGWEPGTAEQEYNNGQTQQIPMQNMVKLKSRLRREISYQGRQLFFEGNINAR